MTISTQQHFYSINNNINNNNNHLILAYQTFGTFLRTLSHSLSTVTSPVSNLKVITVRPVDENQSGLQSTSSMYCVCE